MKKLTISALLACGTTGFYSQNLLWQKDIKSSTQNLLSKVTTTLDEQYLISGSSIQTKKITSDNKQNNGYDFHLIKLDQQGQEVWEKYFSGKSHDYLNATVATPEGGFLLAGTSHSGEGLDKKNPSLGGSDVWLIRINEFGEEIWQKTLGSDKDEEAKAVIQTMDLGYLIAGNVQNSSLGSGSKDVAIFKLDKNGKLVSKIILGGNGLDEVENLIATPDGGALLGIYSRSGTTKKNESNDIDKNYDNIDTKFIAKSTENYGEGDFWIVKLNKEGNVAWEKNFGGQADDHIKSLAFTSSGYLIAGESNSKRSGNKMVDIERGTDIWLLSLTTEGEITFQKSFNFNNRDILMGLSTISSIDNKNLKGVILSGYTQAEEILETDDETFWMLYIDNNGYEQWRKHIKGENHKEQERLKDLKINKDGSIVLAGTSADELGKENWKIVKLHDDQTKNLIDKYDIKLYPNPVSDYVYAEIGFDFHEAEIIVYDMSGRPVQKQNTKNRITKINTQNLIQGAYLLVVKTDNNIVVSEKIIKK